MLTGLLITAFLMGLGGIPHCAAMCGAACAAAMPRGVPLLALVGRCLGYALLGLVASASAGLISQWGRQISMLQPIWVMLQMAAVLLGLWLLWSGRMPRQVDLWGQLLYRRVRDRVGRSTLLSGAPGLKPVLPLLAGMAWAVLPCGLLYAALMVAALASEPWGGALVMLAFALPSALGVWAAPALLRRLRRVPAADRSNSGQALPVVPVLWITPDGGKTAQPGSVSPRVSAERGALVDPRWAVRMAGLGLALMAAWAVSHQLVAQWQAWCA